MAMHKRTQVFFYGTFWKVRMFYNGYWVTLPTLYMTRREAREGAKWHAVN